MEKKGTIPDEIKRFILNSIDSVPHLEALLLLHADVNKEWDGRMMAQSLFLSEKRASEVLEDLRAAGFARAQGSNQLVYHYYPFSKELNEIMERLEETYTTNLIAVTHLIHSKISKQAQDFGDAFRWQKEKEDN